MDYKKPCKIKIWYWNYRLTELEDRYGFDKKQINFEIIQNNERQTLITFHLPSFLNGHDVVKQFLKFNYETLQFLPSLNYTKFETDRLNKALVTFEEGESDKRFDK